MATLDDETQEQVDYVFLGVGKVTDTDKTGGGVQWDSDKDPGTSVSGETTTTTTTSK